MYKPVLAPIITNTKDKFPFICEQLYLKLKFVIKQI